MIFNLQGHWLIFLHTKYFSTSVPINFLVLTIIDVLNIYICLSLRQMFLEYQSTLKVQTDKKVHTFFYLFCLMEGIFNFLNENI